MPLQFGLVAPQGWRMDLAGIADPVEAYETMTRVAQEAEVLGYSSIWLFDHFHTTPVHARCQRYQAFATFRPGLHE